MVKDLIFRWQYDCAEEKKTNICTCCQELSTDIKDTKKNIN